jgi:hypothetical protein
MAMSTVFATTLTRANVTGIIIVRHV